MAGVARLNEVQMSQLANRAAVIEKSGESTWIQSLQQAQVELFSEEKHYSLGSLYTFSSRFKAMVDNKIVVNPTVSKPAAVAEAPQLEEVKPAVAEHSPGLEVFTFGNKISELASNLSKQFEDQLTAELETALNAALSRVERSFEKKLEDARKLSGAVKKQLPRVMVIGVMGEVAFQTESEYGEMLDLRFYKQEENLSLIRAQAKHCDFVVLIVGHINHGHQDCVRNHPGLVFCNGGVTQMKEILLTLACK